MRTANKVKNIKHTLLFNLVRRKKGKALLLQLPFYSQSYRLRSRLRVKRSRRLLKQNTLPNLRLTNKKRALRVFALYNQRKKLASS